MKTFRRYEDIGIIETKVLKPGLLQQPVNRCACILQGFDNRCNAGAVG